MDGFWLSDAAVVSKLRSAPVYGSSDPSSGICKSTKPSVALVPITQHVSPGPEASLNNVGPHAASPDRTCDGHPLPQGRRDARGVGRANSQSQNPSDVQCLPPRIEQSRCAHFRSPRFAAFRLKAGKLTLDKLCMGISV